MSRASAHWPRYCRGCLGSSPGLGHRPASALPNPSTIYQLSRSPHHAAFLPRVNVPGEYQTSVLHCVCKLRFLHIILPMYYVILSTQYCLVLAINDLIIMIYNSAAKSVVVWNYSECSSSDILASEEYSKKSVCRLSIYGLVSCSHHTQEDNV